MPASKNEIISLLPEDSNKPRPRLNKLIIKNFRTIGENPVEIDLDEIVVLIGENNSGKSSILRAYEVAMSDGSNEGKLELDDFPGNEVNQDKLPRIEIHTIITENKPGDQWVQKLESGEMLIRERWTWSEAKKPAKRQGFDVTTSDWSDKVPWGAPNVANSYRPKPHRIEAFASPEKQEKEIVALFAELIKDKAKAFRRPGNTTEKTDYELLIEQITEFQNDVSMSIATEVEDIENQIAEYLGKVFNNYKVKLDANPEAKIDKAYVPFNEPPIISMGPDDGYMAKISAQGSGARRTLLWSALKYLAENKGTKSERPHVLLLDEPELCLHPSAVRVARKVLYDLPKTKNWQVMVTTHSPVFIDLSYDNTTIIRVDRSSNDEVKSTTLYRPKAISLGDSDKENLKLLNVCDPYVHEFFFGGQIIIVEGDTEYTVFSKLKLEYSDEYKDLHIIRARGKAIIPSIVKILNQFTTSYAVLHDADTPQTKTGTKNPMWTVNSNILNAAKGSSSHNPINIIACKNNFEQAILGEDVSNDKPHNALIAMNKDDATLKTIKDLLDALLNPQKAPPKNCVRWGKIEDLQDS